MPLHWMYAGGRFGGSLRRQDIPSEHSFGPSSDGWDPDKTHVYNEWKTINAAVSFTVAFFPESVPFFSRFCFQAEGLFTQEWFPSEASPFSTTTITPGALLKFQAYRHGNMLISVFGGAYTPFRLGDTEDLIAYSSKFPVGWTVGLTFGGKLDPLPGIFFIDMRLSFDEFNTFVKKDDEAYRRRTFTLAVGYEYGFVVKK